MNAIEPNRLIEEPFFDFLCKSLFSDKFEVFPLAGDASSRRYFRVHLALQSWVLMVWEPFEDNEKYPFLSVLNHFERNQIAVPNVVAKSPAEGLMLLEDLGDLTLERKFWENQSHESAFEYYKLSIDELIKNQIHIVRKSLIIKKFWFSLHVSYSIY